MKLLTAPIAIADRRRARSSSPPRSWAGSAARSRRRRPPRTASRSAPRSARACGSWPTTRCSAGCCGERWACRRCGASSARHGCCSRTASWASTRPSSASWRRSAGSGRWWGRCSPSGRPGGSGSAGSSSSSLLVAALGNLLIPLAPAGMPLVAVAFLVGQQLIGDTAVTIYDVTEISMRQARVEDRHLGRVNATVRVVMVLATAGRHGGRAVSSPRRSGCARRRSSGRCSRWSGRSGCIAHRCGAWGAWTTRGGRRSRDARPGRCRCRFEGAPGSTAPQLSPRTRSMKAFTQSR